MMWVEAAIGTATLDGVGDVAGERHHRARTLDDSNTLRIQCGITRASKFVDWDRNRTIDQRCRIVTFIAYN